MVLCLNIEELSRGGFRDKEICGRYPGAGFLPHFNLQAVEAGYQVWGGLEIADAFLNKQAKIEDCYIIQEELNQRGLELVNDGAQAILLFCFESKLFTPHFYDNLPKLKTIFPNRLLFNNGTHKLRFPIFDEDDVREPLPWSTRSDFVLVSANKHWSYSIPLPESPAWMEGVKHELQTARLEAVRALGQRNKLKLYGHGWHPYALLPQDQLSLRPLLYELKAQPCKHKIEAITNFKFAVCFENTRQAGYLTEKIIDCFVAGVVPIYLGDPQVDYHIPRAAFIDFSKFKGWEDCLSFLSKQGHEYFINMIKIGQHFLKTPEGRLHCNKYFAEDLLRMINNSL